MKEMYVSSKSVKVDILIDDRYVSMRFYLLDESILQEAMAYCNKQLENTTEIQLSQYIPDFVEYISRIATEDHDTPDMPKEDVVISTGTTNSYCPMQQLIGSTQDLGTFGYPISRIKELGYVEEKFVLFDYNYNLKKLTPLTILICMGIALVRKVLKWEDVTWGFKYI